jgi:hypothetical protein
MPGQDQPARYKIVVSGQVKAKWSDWFNGMLIECGTSSGQDTTTTLSGIVQDQAALRGLLTKIWDLGLVVIAVERSSHDRSSNEQTSQASQC